MLKKIIAGYSTLLMTVCRFIVIIALCVCAGIVIIFPLWKFAVSFPHIYTIFVATLILAIIGCAIFFKVRRFVLACGDGIERKKHIRRTWIMCAKIVVVCAGLLLFIWSVFAQKAFIGYITLGFVVVIYGILAFGFGKKR